MVSMATHASCEFSGQRVTCVGPLYANLKFICVFKFKSHVQREQI